MKSGISTLALVIALSALPGVSNAQEAADTGEETRKLATVTVTAQKREESLQDVPISMEVMSGEALADLQVNDFQDMTRYVPNVAVQLTAGNNVVYIRGFGSPAANFSFDQAVSLYIDGVYAGKSRQTQGPFFDLERVEVLRGPQGALFGKNTAAGAVSIVSAGPTDTFEGAVKAVYNFDLEGYELSGHVSGPITDRISGRLAVKQLDQDGWIRNLGKGGQKEPQVEQFLARATLRYEGNDNFDYTLKAEFGDNRRIGGMNVAGRLDIPQNPDLTRYSVDSVVGEEGTEATSWLVSGTGNWDLGEYTLTSVTGYSWFRADINNYFDQQAPDGTIVPNSVYNSYPEHFRQVSQELRLLSPTGRRFEYIVGGYYDSSRYLLTQLGGFNIAAFNYEGLGRSDFSQFSKSYSLFGQGTYHFSDTLRAIGSLRYTNTEKRAGFDGELVYGPYPLRPLTKADGSISEDGVDPSITLQWDVHPNAMAYVTYGRGSKSGGFVGNTYGTVDSTFTYDPEKSESFEAGVKSTLLNGALVLNGAVYETSFKDLQTSVYDPNLSTYITGNAASAKSTGVEASLAWIISDQFSINASAAYQDAKYEDYPGAACLASQPLTECNPADPTSVAQNNIGGRPLPYISDFSGNVQLNYTQDLWSDLVFDSILAVTGRSEYFDSDNQSPTFGLQKGFAKVDLRLQVAPQDERWHVALVGKNLTDEITTGSAFNLPAPITSVPRAIFYVEPPRTIALEAGLRF